MKAILSSVLLAAIVGCGDSPSFRGIEPTHGPALGRETDNNRIGYCLAQPYCEELGGATWVPPTVTFSTIGAPVEIKYGGTGPWQPLGAFPGLSEIDQCVEVKLRVDRPGPGVLTTEDEPGHFEVCEEESRHVWVSISYDGDGDFSDQIVDMNANVGEYEWVYSGGVLQLCRR